MSDANEIKALGSVVKVRRGASPRPIGDPKYFGGEVGWVRISDVTQRNYKYLKQTQQYLSPLGESHSVRVNKGDLIMSICATVGKPIIVDMDACIHDGFVQLYDNQNADTEYLFYILQFHEQDFEKRGQPGTQVNLNTSIVENEKIFIPENIKEQQKITKILTTIDNLIEKTETLIGKYLAIKQGMMHDLFTRGIDTNGQVRPSYHVASYLYKQTKFGWIPKEWEIYELNKITSKITDGSHFSPIPQEEGWPIGNVKDMGKYDLNYEGCTKILKSQFDLLVAQNCSPVKNDILLSKDGTIGKVLLFGGKNKIVLLSSVAIIRPLTTINSVYLKYAFESEFFDKQLYAMQSGSALKRIVLKDINKLAYPFPMDSHEQVQIGIRLASIDKKIKNEENALEKYKHIKKGHMQDLLTGKVRVCIE